MKKITYLIISFIFYFSCSLSLQAQKIKGSVSKADNYVEKGNILLAKQEIDLAFEKEVNKLKSKGKSPIPSARTYFVKAKVYQEIASSDDEQLVAFKEDAFPISIASFKKVIEEGKNIYIISANQALDQIYSNFYNKAVNAYNEKKMEIAIDNFEKAYMANSNDTNIVVNIVSCALNLQDKDIIFKYCNKLIDLKYNESWIYTTMVGYLIQDKEYDKAIELINKGLQDFPGDKNLLSQKSQSYINMDKVDEAIRSYEELLKTTSDDPVLYYNLGVLNERMKKIENAKKYYQKAVELQPDYYDALYNLGAIYYNQALKINKELQQLPMDKNGNYLDKSKSIELDNTIKDYYKMTYPLFEKAVEVKKDEQIVFQLLERLYYSLQMTEDLQRVRTILSSFKD